MCWRCADELGGCSGGVRRCLRAARQPADYRRARPGHCLRADGHTVHTSSQSHLLGAWTGSPLCFANSVAGWLSLLATKRRSQARPGTVEPQCTDRHGCSTIARLRVQVGSNSEPRRPVQAGRRRPNVSLESLPASDLAVRGGALTTRREFRLLADCPTPFAIR